MPAEKASKKSQVTDNAPAAVIQNGPSSLRNEQGRFREVDPEVIILSPELDALRERESQEYQESVMNLAQTIWEERQIHPGLGMLAADGGGGIVLIAGQRRLEAVKLIRSEAGQEILGLTEAEKVEASGMLYQIEIRDDVRTSGGAFRLAMIENVQQRRFTAIEFARNIVKIRAMFEFDEGPAGTKDVADFLAVSPATVMQHEKLLGLSAEKQAEVHAGRMTAEAALEFLNVQPGQEQKVEEKAKDLAVEEEKKADERRRPNRKHNPTPVIPKTNGKLPVKAGAVGSAKKADEDSKPAVDAKPKPVKPPVVGRRHVVAAAKALGAVKELKAPKMGELAALLETWTGPGLPEVIRTFAETGMEWCKGKASDKQWTAALDDVADSLPAPETEEGGDLGPQTIAVPTRGKKKQPVKVKGMATTAAATLASKKSAPAKKAPAAKKKAPAKVAKSNKPNTKSDKKK